MKSSNKHRITIQIPGAAPFKLPVDESEESFYRKTIEHIVGNCNRMRYGADADTDDVALAKVALYYAIMYYRKSELLRNQGIMLDNFEQQLDSLLSSLDRD